MFKLSFSEIRHKPTAAPRHALLVAIQLPHQSDAEVQASLSELEQLVSGLDIVVLSRSVQKRPAPGAPGSGKLRELALQTTGQGTLAREPGAPIDRLVLLDDALPFEATPLESPGLGADEAGTEPSSAVPSSAVPSSAVPSSAVPSSAVPSSAVPSSAVPSSDVPSSDVLADLVIMDCELSPADTRYMELALGVEVMDRPGVILRVFELRAQTREARLETEIARLGYEAPRVRDQSTDDDRQGGGGRGGRGHSNVELQKREIRERMRSLRRELDTLYAAQAARREKRQETFGVALVGYTNAGKSTWMRALTGSDVLIEDKLFATLGTTVRALRPEATPSILVSDTVGFIRNLPHSLIASFRATLDEARHASLLLFIADASDPELRAQLTVTREVLAEIGAMDLPSIVVLNKADRLSASERTALAAEFPDARLLSARDAADAAALRAQVIAFFEQRMVELEIEVPYAKLALVGRIHQRARVLSEHYTEAGAVLHVRALHSAAAQIKRALADTAS